MGDDGRLGDGEHARDRSSVFGRIAVPFKSAVTPLEYVIFPIVIAAAVRLGQPAVSLVVLTVSVVTIANTVSGGGPFGAREAPRKPACCLQVFIGVHGRAAACARGHDCGAPDRRTPARGRAWRRPALATASDLPQSAGALLAAFAAVSSGRPARCGWSMTSRPICVASTVWSDGAAHRGVCRGDQGGRCHARRRAAWPRVGHRAQPPGSQTCFATRTFPRAAHRAAGGAPRRVRISDLRGRRRRARRDRDASTNGDDARIGDLLGDDVRRWETRSASSSWRKRAEAAVAESDTQHARDAARPRSTRSSAWITAASITEFNPAAERTFGYRRADALGRDLADLVIPPTFATRTARA